MSFATFLQDALGVPSTKVPISIASFVSYIIPPVVCYFASAILAVTPRTRALRAALCPIVAVLALRAAFSVDMSHGDPEQKSENFNLAGCMVALAAHNLSWMFAEKPLVRHFRPAKSAPSTIMDVLDLATNSRGIGWEWSRGLYIAPETRPTDRRAFAFHGLRTAIVYGFLCDLFQEATRTFSTRVGSSLEITIFDPTLPVLLRYLRSSIVTVLTGLAARTGIEASYNITLVVAIVLLDHDPAQWPPLFDSPWAATSLADFWGRRWHQFHRYELIKAGYPFSIVLGRVGTIIGAFLASALLHYLIIIPLDSRPEMWQMFVGFGMMAPGVVAERAFYKLTGRRVGGVVGWVWTMTWLLLWGHVITDGFMKAGMFACPSFPAGKLLPVRGWVKKLVVAFDDWLHTV